MAITDEGRKLLEQIQQSRLPLKWSYSDKKLKYFENLKKVTAMTTSFNENMFSRGVLLRKTYNDVGGYIRELNGWLKMIDRKDLLNRRFPDGQDLDFAVVQNTTQIFQMLEELIIKECKCARAESLPELWDHIINPYKLHGDIKGGHTAEAMELFLQQQEVPLNQISWDAHNPNITVMRFPWKGKTETKTVFPRGLSKTAIIDIVIGALENAHLLKKKLLLSWFRSKKDLFEMVLRNTADDRDGEKWLGKDPRTGTWVVFIMTDGLIGTAYPIPDTPTTYEIKYLNATNGYLWQK